MATESGGYLATSVAIADVNGDGKPDLVVANYCATAACSSTGSVGVLLGNGDGTFQTAVTYDSGGFLAVSLALADVNGDGRLDVVVAHYCLTTSCDGAPGGVGVLIGDGDGTFQSPTSYSSGGGLAVSVAVADLTANGRVDIVVANQCVIACGTKDIVGGVGILLGNGDGTFQSAVSYDSGGAVATVAHRRLESPVTVAQQHAKRPVAIPIAQALIGHDQIRISVAIDIRDGHRFGVVVRSVGSRRRKAQARRKLQARLGRRLLRAKDRGQRVGRRDSIRPLCCETDGEHENGRRADEAKNLNTASNRIAKYEISAMGRDARRARSGLHCED